MVALLYVFVIVMGLASLAIGAGAILQMLARPYIIVGCHRRGMFFGGGFFGDTADCARTLWEHRPGRSMVSPTPGDDLI